MALDKRRVALATCAQWKLQKQYKLAGLSSGVVKCWSKACYFFYFNDYVSILKGSRSLWKHIKTEPSQARWGHHVQKLDVDPAGLGVKISSRLGAKWVNACTSDVPEK